MQPLTGSALKKPAHKTNLTEATEQELNKKKEIALVRSGGFYPMA